MNATQLKLEIETADDHVVATPIGRIDAMTSPGLQEDIDAILTDGATRLVMDLERVPFVSSAGLRVFIHAAKKLKASGKFAVCNISDNVLQVFQLAGFDRIMTLEETRAAAITKVKE